MVQLRRAKSINDIYVREREILPFEGDWKAHIGCPEIRGTWFIYGHSGNGKTSYVVQMVRMLTKFGACWYLGHEEGDAESFKEALKRVGMEAVRKQFKLLDDNYEEIMLRITRRNRPRFLFVDSLQAMMLTKKEYMELEKRCTDKGIQLIIIGHAEGKKPEGRLGKHIEYMAFVKIWVQGFKAFPKSRYGGTEPFIIYAKRAAEYWADITLKE